MPIGDIFDENLLGQIQQQGQQKAAQQQAIEQILLPALLRTNPQSTQFETLLEQQQAGPPRGPLGRLEQTTGPIPGIPEGIGQPLADVGRFALGAVGDTIRGGPSDSGLSEGVIRAIAEANQVNRQEGRRESLEDFTSRSEVTAANRAPARVPETAQEKATGKFDALAELKKTNPELFERVKPAQKSAAGTKVNDRITEELGRSRFVKGPLGIIDTTTGRRPEGSRIQDMSDAVLRGSVGEQGIGGTLAPPADDPGAPAIDPQELRNLLTTELKRKNDELLQAGLPPLTQEQKIQIARDLKAQQGGVVGQ